MAVTNSDLPDLNQPLQAVQLFPDGRLVVHTMGFDGIPLQHGSNSVLSDETVQGRPDLGPPGKTWYSVTRFESHNALVVTRQLPSGHLRVTVLALRDGLPRLRVGMISAPPLPRGARTVAVATWNPPSPDLFVIDHGAGRSPVIVRIYSGESGFHKLIGVYALPPNAAGPERWVWGVARLGGQRPDVVFVKRRGLSGKPEFHVLDAGTHFATFAEHVAIPARPIPARDQVVIGTRIGQAVAYLVRFGGRAPSVRLMALPDRVNVPR